jgi:PAS domain S-box-containing protein
VRKKARAKKSGPAKRGKPPAKGANAGHPAFERERLLHDLQVHQIELETQNQELRETHRLLELSRDRYADLYDFAPAGYLTTDDKGNILEINLTAAGMLGVERSRLIGFPFGLYVAKDDLPAFRAHFRKLARTGEPAVTELGLMVKSGDDIQVEMQSVRSPDTGDKTRPFRSTITDITRRKLAEAASRTSRELLERALAGAEMCLWERDLRGGKVLLSPRWAETLGYSAAEASAANFTWESMVHPDDLPRVSAAVAAHLAADTPHYEADYRLRAKSGEWRWVLSRGKVVERDRSGKPLRISGTYLDIHPRKQAEEAARNTEARLGAILATAVEGIITIDEQGRVESFNGAAERIFGYAAGEAVGRNVNFLMPSPYHERHDGYLDHYRRTGERKVIGIGREVQGQRKNGEIFPLKLAVSEVPLEGRRIFTGFVRDITERKRAEEAARHSEALLARAQEIAHVGSYELDAPLAGKSFWSAETFRIVGLDPAAKELTPLEFINQLVHPDDRARVREAIEEAARKNARYDAEYRIVRPDGSIRYVHSVAEPAAAPANKTAKFVGFLQDVTDRKQLEREILAISEREQSRIGQDLHDGICQCLAGIEFRLSTLKHSLGEASKKHADETTEVARLIREVIEQTRMLARGLSPVVLETHGLMDALAELAAYARRTFQIDCSFHCPPPVPVRHNAVATHLYRIAQEALHNAIRHGGAKAVTIKLVASQGRIMLGVEDNGAGFAAKPPNHKGMGLRVMQYRAGMIGGSLVVQHRPEGGTSVVCSLDAAGANEEPGQAKPEAGDSVAPSK